MHKKKNSHKILFADENDFFLLNGQDSYYTNGFLLQYSFAKQKNKFKHIHQFSVGQNMYTTRNRRLVWTGVEPLDRPYCGYIFLRYSNTKFLTANKLFAYSLELAGTGDYAMAKKLYTWYHQKLGLYAYPYWDYEIPTSWGINANIKYAKSYLSKNKKWQFTPIAESTVGSYMINAKLGTYFTTGKFTSIDNSVLFNADLQTKKSNNNQKQQLCYYLFPQIIFQGYNVTLQGKMNTTYPPPVFTSKPNLLVVQTALGVAYSKKNISAKAEYCFQTRETKSQLSNHRWVGLHFGYKF